MGPLDIALFHAFNAGPGTPAWLLALARWASETLPTLAGVGLALALALQPRRSWRAVLLCVAALLVGWCLAQVVRAWVPMPRPGALGIGMQWIAHGKRAGFPSLHATGAFAFAAALWLAGARRWALPALAVALLIAWSRVCLGVHFPSDVLAGMLTGTLAACIAAAVGGAARALLRKRAIAPAPQETPPA
ncbi:phosphatase PAP2 family protein [Ramlibacter sp. H39-3-26]|uniref:phosphatase PAP2 family protein n=1 Tax=Curvibacter soli TaxID=3031331 RepID=UPI0023DA7AAC|nr:phosphatase PAP2 family protein [Ramlibacter sp. H39-3-26]MDF1484612.1 phosphatase PAP2 family protein [Ramlibacter sp. H39-3-26]